MAERLTRQFRTLEADEKVVSVGEFLEGPSGQNTRHIPASSGEAEEHGGPGVGGWWLGVKPRG